ncbi:right-handed parallel beta-helix repeat-containing protein [Paenibacillus sp. 19GGS1-52]|uniref:NosD domain-containing protein n=1 Tax=Paenibacillus sp. 19GGS1-52 TaxID=2758563 RepID=UPI001EFA7D39|nr:NosD domain-containing protein [Paenibacillus sp. 19GGS1-52]ULO05617.1 right-handed parallel beta-helix repeat-containing protein [Paenibacillus sp. 19GGS1-52]
MSRKGNGSHHIHKVRVWFLLILMNVVWIVPLNAGIATASSISQTEAIALQPIIDQAQTGDVLVLAPGTYLGPVVIDKRLSISGEGAVTLLNHSEDSAIQINSSGVKLQEMNIQQDADGDSAAIVVRADQVTLANLVIHTGGYGIILRDANGGVIRNNKIRWFIPKGQAPGTSGNGIDLYNSHGTKIMENEITYLRDGIYLENSRNTVVDQNKLYYLRYGIHCMYIDGSYVTNNIGEYNITGAMVMGVTNVVVSGNSFRKQNQNVHSQGILLYDVHTSAIVNNTVEGNRVGIYMEQSSDNDLRDNIILRNFIGVQFLGAEGNQFQNNGFIANVIEAEATDSKDNKMNRNFWDSFQGLDVTNEGTSDIPYAINPFYQQLISNNSAYQLFFQSPGMTFLSDMFTNGKEEWSTDHTPLMKLTTGAPAETASSYGIVMVVGWLLLFLSVVTIIYLGVLRL